MSRTCGGCTLCCKVLGVTELGKPVDVWCQHAQKGAGCRIYADRPHSCRMFSCEWIESSLPPDLRPDRIHGVIAPEEGHRLVLHEDPGYPGDAGRTLAPLWAALHRTTPDVAVFVRRGAETVAL